MSTEGQSQYALISSVPLIKSPSLWVPPPVQLPEDIHPLPDNVSAYFVYPFTLEPHIITLESSRRSTQSAHAARREAYLKSREEEKQRRKREALRRVAPGFEPDAGVLVPEKPAGRRSIEAQSPPIVDPMQSLVSQLEELETRRGNSSTSTQSLGS